MSGTQVFSIDSAAPVCFWQVDATTDVCAICKNDLTESCITCTASEDPSVTCETATGQCGHTFHFHCITRWLAERQSCPLDSIEWDFA